MVKCTFTLNLSWTMYQDLQCKQVMKKITAMTHNAYKCYFFPKQNNIKLYSVITENHENNVISKEHPVSGGGGVSGSRFNVRDG